MEEWIFDDYVPREYSFELIKDRNEGILISPDGEISMADPSHTIALVKILSEQTGESAKKISMNLKEGIDYLCGRTGYIAVWRKLYKGTFTNKQKEKLLELKKAGWFLGDIKKGSGYYG